MKTISIISIILILSISACNPPLITNSETSIEDTVEEVLTSVDSFENEPPPEILTKAQSISHIIIKDDKDDPKLPGPPQFPLHGDVTGNGKIDIWDAYAIWVYMYDVFELPIQIRLSIEAGDGDLNRDGVTDMDDINEYIRIHNLGSFKEIENGDKEK